MQGQRMEGGNAATQLYVGVKEPPAEINAVLTLDVEGAAADIL